MLAELSPLNKIHLTFLTLPVSIFSAVLGEQVFRCLHV